MIFAKLNLNKIIIARFDLKIFVLAGMARLFGQLSYFLVSYQLVRLKSNVYSVFWPVWRDKHLEVLT